MRYAAVAMTITTTTTIAMMALHQLRTSGVAYLPKQGRGTGR
jgi:hypothetical protein